MPSGGGKVIPDKLTDSEKKKLKQENKAKADPKRAEAKKEKNDACREKRAAAAARSPSREALSGKRGESALRFAGRLEGTRVRPRQEFPQLRVTTLDGHNWRSHQCSLGALQCVASALVASILD
eukprot:CAMPEP_0204533534 /NCGR_PEP_ID=MMETSP0661-20131031/12343_1 /ASSEMBLY_ACC=CAM_ASM_000606 /TAXON_ID=109239 /ORGANISM="Alexandrium margalefi, Strain AMGDE01CS-322" /LENGTH=123 /DNA_ID=CAMNT_0051539889 /DNA_START=72 /DNA_END=444 /DNA_ORIENTATION=+